MAAGSRSERILTRRIGVGSKDKMLSSPAMSLHGIALRADLPRTVGPRSSPGPYILAGTIGAELRTYRSVDQIGTRPTKTGGYFGHCRNRLNCCYARRRPHQPDSGQTTAAYPAGNYFQYGEQRGC
jgi:hypothetical protein